MNTSILSDTFHDGENDELTAIASKFAPLLASDLRSISRMAGGRNSRVYLLETSSPKKYVGKLYFRGDSRAAGRLSTEYQMLAFLRKHGFQDVPRPVAMDGEQMCGIYEFMEGKPVNPKEATELDIQRLAGFLERLRLLSHMEECRGLPDASEACFSGEAVGNVVRKRLNRLLAAADTSEMGAQLQAFLKERFQPTYQAIKTWSKDRLSRTDFAYTAVLPPEMHTLSPSDFGFHNCLKQENGKIVFLDFEYFGWDDPAKMICDCLRHPAMLLSPSLKKTYLSKMFKLFPDGDALKKRVHALYPLLGLNWCLILLNEFIPRDLARRRFSGDIEGLRERQLGKATRLLTEVLEERAGISG